MIIEEVSSMATQVVNHTVDLALHIDRAAAKARVQRLRTQYPNLDRRALANKLIQRSRWWGAACGTFTGIPGNPWTAVPAAFTDLGVMLRVELTLAAHIALLFDPTYLDGEEPPYELLVPIMGGRIVGEFARDLAIQGAMGWTRTQLRERLAKETLKEFKKFTVRYLGRKVTQPGIISKTLPVVGGVVGGLWNWAEIKVVGARVYKYFDGQNIQAEAVPV